MAFWRIAAGRPVWRLAGNYLRSHRRLNSRARKLPAMQQVGAVRNAEPRCRLASISPPQTSQIDASSSTAPSQPTKVSRRRATARRRTHVFTPQNSLKACAEAISNRIPDHIVCRNRPPSAPSSDQHILPGSTKVGSSIHRVRPASGFLLVAQSKATRRADFSYNSGLVQPRRSRLGTNDQAGPIRFAAICTALTESPRSV